MKTATIPSIRVEPDLRKAAEGVLHEGETLSSFMEEALRAGIRERKARQEFLARGLAARDEAKESGEYYPADEVLGELRELLEDAEKKSGR